MLRRIVFAALVFFVFVFSESAIGQKPEYIQFKLANNQPSQSIFSNIEIVDTRFDTVYMGFVQKGAFNRKAPIKLTRSFEEEFTQTAEGYIANATRENGTLLVNVRNFFISELTGAMSETGTFIFKAGCYLKEGDGYRFMFSIDTAFVVRGMDVTQKLLRTVNEQVGKFFGEACAFDRKRLYSSSFYSLHDIEHIDDVEKKAIPVYNVALPAKGLYASFEDFKNNRPSDTVFIKELNKRSKKPEFFRVKVDGTKGKLISLNQYYAVCDGEQLYISTDYGLYPVTKKDLDFYFTGKGKDAANASTVAMASFMFGIIGGMLASIPETATFEYRIDHTSGKFLPLRKISD